MRNETYNPYSFNDYEDFKHFFIIECKNNILNPGLKLINAFEFIGMYATLTSQMDLKIFNNFINDNDLITNSERTSISAVSSEDNWKFEKIGNESYLTRLNKSVNQKKSELNLNKFFKILQYSEYDNKSIEESDINVKKLKKGEWNKFIPRILDKYNTIEYEWFKKIRSYRNELIHSIDDYYQPMDSIYRKNLFKKSETIFDAEKFIKLIWELNERTKEDFNKINENKGKNVLFLHKDFLLNYSTLLGFAIIYNNSALKFKEKQIDKCNHNFCSCDSLSMGLKFNSLMKFSIPGPADLGLYSNSGGSLEINDRQFTYIKMFKEILVPNLELSTLNSMHLEALILEQTELFHPVIFYKGEEIDLNEDKLKHLKKYPTYKITQEIELILKKNPCIYNFYNMVFG
ncbi:hypothetical protein [Spiroplasma endosymbiont of Amphibalanus improvisus]|uniref:hypothetical protein n=1 Tax=Spiroplasma endosymbiont of Amphibalanus improvisus TaxID=3066327 RepID=UPI00313E86AB